MWPDLYLSYSLHEASHRALGGCESMFIDCLAGLYLRLGEFIFLSGTSAWAAIVSVGIALPIFVVSGLYRSIFRYSGWPAILAVSRAVAIYGLLYASVITAFEFCVSPVPSD